MCGSIQIAQDCCEANMQLNSGPVASKSTSADSGADLEFDKALTDAMRSSVDIAHGCSEASHANLHLAPHGGIAAQGGEEILGGGGDLEGLQELDTVGQC